MELIKEEYTSKEGKTVTIERYKGKKTQCVLTNDNHSLSPIVSSIEYDEEHDVFRVVDEYFSVDEHGRQGDLSAKVYFYMDYDGEPIGMVYTDASDGFFTVQTRYHEDGVTDRWFTAYLAFKRRLGEALARKHNSRMNHLEECAKKMLILNTKKEK